MVDGCWLLIWVGSGGEGGGVGLVGLFLGGGGGVE